MNSLVEAILEGDCGRSVALARSLLADGASREEMVTLGLEEAMSRLDGKCTLERFNLLEVMLAGRAVTDVMKVLFPSGEVPTSHKGTVVLASLEGDVHDLGKNIFKMVLVSKGYRVVDLGRDCKLEKLVDVVEHESPVAVGVSGLVTSIIPRVRQVKGLLRARGLSGVRVVAGGAALRQSTRDKLDVDFVAESAFDGARFVDSAVGEAA